MINEPIIDDHMVVILDAGWFEWLKVTYLLEVEGAAHYLRKYAGNLDIMTSAALRMGEEIARYVGTMSLITWICPYEETYVRS